MSRWVIDVEATMHQAQRLKSASDDLAAAGKEAARIIAGVPAGAGASSGGIGANATAGARDAKAAAEDLRTRAAYLWLAEQTGDPVTLGIANMRVPPPLGPGLLNSLGFGLSAGTAGATRWSISMLQAAGDYGTVADKLMAETIPTIQHLLRSGKWGPEDIDRLTDRLADLAGEASGNRAMSQNLRQAAVRWRALSDGLRGAGALLQFYNGYTGSSAQTEVGQVMSAGLSVVFTDNLGGAAIDFVTGGAGTASVDFVVVAREEIRAAMRHRDSRLLLGAGTQAWQQDNLNGDNGWMLANYAELGEYYQPAASEWLDEVAYPGFPFDGDGSVNWTPW